MICNIKYSTDKIPIFYFRICSDFTYPVYNINWKFLVFIANVLQHSFELV